MKKFLSGRRGKTLLLIYVFFAALAQTSCHPKINRGGPPTNHAGDWLNWNYIFKEGTDSATRQATIAQITEAISNVRSVRPADTGRQNPNAGAAGRIAVHPLTSYLSGYLGRVIRAKNGYSLDNTQVHFCSCHDTLLWNVTADLNIGGSGQSTPTAPPPPSPGASGGSVAVVDSNGSVASPSSVPPVLTSGLIGFSGDPEVSGKVVLGIIDSGIDSTLFDRSIFQRLFASDGSGKINFVAGGPASAYQDDDAVRHGSAVAAIALNAFYTQSQADGKPELPRLMVIRALDGKGMGTTLSVSCALSYAIRHRVSLINASLGYWNAQNAVINYYLEQSAKYDIPVVAAAGNDPRDHTPSVCGVAIDGHNLLRPGNMFFPACQCVDPRYCIISVTGLSNPVLPCRYQNFSSRYVSVGVVNKSNSCCGFSLPFINSGYVLDGSSFATPVISGQLGYRIYKDGSRGNATAYMQLLQPQKAASGFVTWDGQYITY
ncbi:MAG: S8/S53 family peptidase [Bacteroidetes bacterium]|nr:S8/S53 family peptidase [Bacteroidota bacterium]